MKIKTLAKMSKYLIEKGGIYTVLEVGDNYYEIECCEKATGRLRLPKKYCKEVTPEKFNWDCMAKVVKWLQLTKYEEFMDVDEPIEETLQKLHHKPIEYYLINEFDHFSSFCSIFRGTKVTKNGRRYCYCPMAVWNQKDAKDYDTFCDGCVNCMKKNGEVLSDAELYERVKKISLKTIKTMLKKVKIKTSLIQHLKDLWFNHISIRLY